MIYWIIWGAIIIVVFVSFYIKEHRMRIKKLQADIEYYQKIILSVNKTLAEKDKEIKVLIDGGLCEQEAVQMKYRKIWEDEKRSLELALRASKLNNGGLNSIGGRLGIFQSRF